MANTLSTVIPLGSKSKSNNTSLYSRLNERYHHNSSDGHRDRRTESLWRELNSWTGTNVTATSASSGGITASDAIFSITTAGEDFQLETVTRAADATTGLVLLETIDIDRSITTNATTVSLSVFSQ